jgi:dihydrofolate reductase
MRRIYAFNRVSADGYFSKPDGDLNWAVPDEELDQQAMSGMPSTDTILFGRTTYQAFESFWPHALDDAAGDPHAPGRKSPAIRAMATWINEAHKLVFSRTLKQVSWRNARILPAFDPEQVIALKKAEGKDIMIFGSGAIASLLTQHALIDEYLLVVAPVLLGSGRSLIRDVTKSLRLELLDAKPSRAGNVLLRYAPLR